MNLQEEPKQFGHKSDTTNGEIICFIFLNNVGTFKKWLSYVSEHSNLQENTLIAICKICTNLLRESSKIAQRNNQIHIT